MGRQDQKHILVVDDDDDIVEILGIVIEQMGNLPLKLTSAVSALDLILHNHIDLAVIDVTMGEISGLALAESIRAKNIQFPIIIVSGNFSTDLGTYLWQLGITAVLPKPVLSATLTEAIESALRSAA